MELVLASISNNEGSGPTGDSMIGLCGWDGGIYLETRNSSRLDKPKITKIDLQYWWRRGIFILQVGSWRVAPFDLASTPLPVDFIPWQAKMTSSLDTVEEREKNPLHHWVMAHFQATIPPKKTSPAFAGAALKAAVLGRAAFWMDPEEPCFRMGLQEMECYYDTILME